MSKNALSEKNEQLEQRAAKAGLAYIDLIENWITRHRCGRGFTYRSPSGKRLRGERSLQRIESLVIPPAWNDVATTAKKLGNTKAVCRSSYIHPGLLIAAESGELEKLLRKLPTRKKAELTIDETRLLAILPNLEST